MRSIDAKYSLYGLLFCNLISSKIASLNFLAFIPLIIIDWIILFSSTKIVNLLFIIFTLISEKKFVSYKSLIILFNLLSSMLSPILIFEKFIIVSVETLTLFQPQFHLQFEN